MAQLQSTEQDRHCRAGANGDLVHEAPTLKTRGRRFFWCGHCRTMRQEKYPAATRAMKDCDELLFKLVKMCRSAGPLPLIPDTVMYVAQAWQPQNVQKGDGHHQDIAARQQDPVLVELQTSACCRRIHINTSTTTFGVPTAVRRSCIVLNVAS